MGKRGRAAVVVLGDIGRSPRMQYHALSLERQANLNVDIVAYGGSEPHGAVLENPCIQIHRMKPIILPSSSRILRYFLLPLKAIAQFFMLLWFLCVKIPAPDLFLVQNPPSVPTLLTVYLASWWRGSKFVVDWHNFGYTLLSLSLGRSSGMVYMYHWFEKHYGRKADASLCVTKAMQHELAQNWDIKAAVLYDQPPEFFRPASLQEKHELFCRLSKFLAERHGTCDFVTDELELYGSDRSTTLFTALDDGEIASKLNRPALIVSSTSWTPDEDFEILLEAADLYDKRVSVIQDNLMEEKHLSSHTSNGKQFPYPRLLFIITGKGPEREKYEQKIKKMRLKHVAFLTIWLSAEDYPLLLGSADLGVCLHVSSSGLDLPMKVVDMFGCGLPVCAVSYSCIQELVKVEKNGLLFSSSSELADQFMIMAPKKKQVSPPKGDPSAVSEEVEDNSTSSTDSETEYEDFVVGNGNGKGPMKTDKNSNVNPFHALKSGQKVNTIGLGRMLVGDSSTNPKQNQGDLKEIFGAMPEAMKRATLRGARVKHPFEELSLEECERIRQVFKMMIEQDDNETALGQNSLPMLLLSKPGVQFKKPNGVRFKPRRNGNGGKHNPKGNGDPPDDPNPDGNGGNGRPRDNHNGNPRGEEQEEIEARRDKVREGVVRLVRDQVQFVGGDTENAASHIRHFSSFVDTFVELDVDVDALKLKFQFSLIGTAQKWYQSLTVDNDIVSWETLWGLSV